MNQKTIKPIVDLEIILDIYPKLSVNNKELADAIITYRIAQLSGINEEIAGKYRDRYILLTGGYK